MGTIKINGLKLNTIIGVHQWERERPQALLADLTLHLDIAEAAKADDLTLTVDYDTLSSKLTSAVTDTDFQLLEALGDFICTFVLESAPRITSVDLLLTKPVAVANAKSIQVQLTKTSTLTA